MTLTLLQWFCCTSRSAHDIYFDFTVGAATENKRIIPLVERFEW